jgi:tripartite-type tricarboxylate transporter receptor subunit TctC
MNRLIELVKKGIGATTLVAALALPHAAQAEFPERPVTLVVPYAAGGSSDIVGRLFGERLERILGQAVVIENAAGASGSIGAQRVANANPDGHTLLVGSGSEMLIFKHLNPKVRYDTFQDFKPIAMLGIGPIAVVGKPELKANTITEVIALAKASPELNYGTAGVGTFMHLVGEAVNSYNKTKIKHVAYRGAAPVMQDIIGNHVELGVASLASALPFIKAGQAKAFAVSSPERTDLAPGIPSLAELPDMAGFHLELWIALFAPGKTPDDIVRKLEAAAAQAINDPEFKRKMAEQALVAREIKGADLTKYLAAENEKYKTIIESANITRQ